MVSVLAGWLITEGGRRGLTSNFLHGGGMDVFWNAIKMANKTHLHLFILNLLGKAIYHANKITHNTLKLRYFYETAKRMFEVLFLYNFCILHMKFSELGPKIKFLPSSFLLF
jgi:hypothetical protein